MIENTLLTCYVLYTGSWRSCNDYQTVIVKISYLYSNLKMSRARIASKNAMESSKSVNLYIYIYIYV